MIVVVRRPFTSLGIHYSVGSVITDPTEIKLYKSKVREGKILEIDEKDINRYQEYFLQKFSVDLKTNVKKVEEKRKFTETVIRQAEQEEQKRLEVLKAVEDAAAKVAAEEDVRVRKETEEANKQKAKPVVATAIIK